MTESEEEIQQQRREMEAGFLVQTQQLEAKYKQDASNAIQARPEFLSHFLSLESSMCAAVHMSSSHLDLAWVTLCMPTGGRDVHAASKAARGGGQSGPTT